MNIDKVETKYPFWLENFIDIYQQLSTDNLDQLASIYHDDVTFIDPIHKVQGFANLHHYFLKLYENLSKCHFVIDQVIYENEQAAIYWTMTYQHPKLNAGDDVIVSGSSHIKGTDEKVIYHRDYLDVGLMLYEQLPLLGKLIKWIKNRAAQ